MFAEKKSGHFPSPPHPLDLPSTQIHPQARKKNARNDLPIPDREKNKYKGSAESTIRIVNACRCTYVRHADPNTAFLLLPPLLLACIGREGGGIWQQCHTSSYNTYVRKSSVCINTHVCQGCCSVSSPRLLSSMPRRQTNIIKKRRRATTRWKNEEVARRKDDKKRKKRSLITLMALSLSLSRSLTVSGGTTSRCFLSTERKQIKLPSATILLSTVVV